MRLRYGVIDKFSPTSKSSLLSTTVPAEFYSTTHWSHCQIYKKFSAHLQIHTNFVLLAVFEHQLCIMGLGLVANLDDILEISPLYLLISISIGGIIIGAVYSLVDDFLYPNKSKVNETPIVR
jgi:hypothetical protein